MEELSAADQFLDLWDRWSRSFDHDVSLAVHADLDEQFRNFAYDCADAIAAALDEARKSAQK